MPRKQKRPTLQQALAVFEQYNKSNPANLHRCPDCIIEVVEAARRETQAAPALLEALQLLAASSAEYTQFMANKKGLAWAQYLGEMHRLDANVQEALQQASAAIAAATEGEN